MKNLKIKLLISILAFVILSCNKPETKVSQDNVSTSAPTVDSKNFPEEETLTKLQSYLMEKNTDGSKSYRILGWREISENEVSIYYQVKTKYDNGNDNFETSRVYRLKNKDEYIWVLTTGSYGTTYSIINKQK